MVEVKSYPKDFIERTRELLDKLEPEAKKIGLEVTFFLNCLLGMIVSALENIEKCDKAEFRKRLNDKDVIKYIPKKIKAIKDAELIRGYKSSINEYEFLKNINEPVIKLEQTEIKFIPYEEIMNYQLEWLLKKIRNGIAHQNIMPTNKSGKWKGIRIWNYNHSGLQNFAIEFKVNELKKFSKFIVSTYLKSYKEL